MDSNKKYELQLRMIQQKHLILKTKNKKQQQQKWIDIMHLRKVIIVRFNGIK